MYIKKKVPRWDHYKILNRFIIKFVLNNYE